MPQYAAVCRSMPQYAAGTYRLRTSRRLAASCRALSCQLCTGSHVEECALNPGLEACCSSATCMQAGMQSNARLCYNLLLVFFAKLQPPPLREPSPKPLLPAQCCRTEEQHDKDNCRNSLDDWSNICIYGFTRMLRCYTGAKRSARQAPPSMAPLVVASLSSAVGRSPACCSDPVEKKTTRMVFTPAGFCNPCKACLLGTDWCCDCLLIFDFWISSFSLDIGRGKLFLMPIKIFDVSPLNPRL